MEFKMPSLNKPLLLASLLTAATSLSSLSHAGTSNYVEYGIGATQAHSFNSEENKGLKDVSIGGTAKLLIAGRISRSRSTWFELGMAHSQGNDINDTRTKNQFLSAGLKFTTDPRSKVSSFLRLGGGKTFSTTMTTGEANEEERYNHYYLGTGMSFRLNNKQAVNVEVQRYGEEGEEIGLNTVFVSFNQFL